MPAAFTVKLTPRFLKDLQALSNPIQRKVLDALTRLETEPFGPAPPVKRLKGKGIGQWRLRVGVYRIRYDVIRRDVVLYRVRDRQEIYRD
jgi:mRNA-degrading endonuclease RelE of RelBE toxin-antitoxin system